MLRNIVMGSIGSSEQVIEKVCTRCKTSKALEEFGVCRRTRDGHDYICLNCKAEKKRDYYYKNLEKERIRRRDYNRMHKEYQSEYKKIYIRQNERKVRVRKKDDYYRTTYGITLEQKRAMIEGQDFKCLCCDIDLNKIRPDRVCIDHDHKTGKIRGILCHYCNVVVGLLDENESNAHKIVDYIKKHCKG